jgi:hypothetical protein
MKFLDLFKKKSKPEETKALVPIENNIHDNKIPAPPSLNNLKFPQLNKKPTFPQIPKLKNIPKQPRHIPKKTIATIDQPLFIKGQKFQELITELHHSKNSIKDLNSNTNKIENIQKEKDKHFTNFKKNIESIQKKLIHMDKTLFK